MTLFALLAVAPIYYHLPALVLAISLVYSATRYDDWDAIFGEALRWGLRMVFFMFCIAVVLVAAAWWI